MTMPIGAGSINNGFLRKTATPRQAVPISVSTGGGQEVVSRPPTKVSPPNAVSSVNAALGSATPLATNTATGGGDYVARVIPTKSMYYILGGLAALLLIVFLKEEI